ncbi:MAG: DnaJ domain-containing protein [Dehalococcoidia bacterium]|nr:DnaJ domain-containing protein [Dehalococcoidia bacterium]
MKDYYSILGVSRRSGQEEIKHAFRNLAMRYHPDRNPGNEKAAEEKFKEINEAYAVLRDEGKRGEYDRRGQASFGGYRSQYARERYYSQEQVFRDAFTNPQQFQEIFRMFQEAGLRFDRGFVNDTFFGGQGFAFSFFAQPGERRQPAAFSSRGYRLPLLMRLGGKVLGFALRKMLGLRDFPRQWAGGNLYQEIVLSSREAEAGCDRKINYKRGDEKKKLIVRVPPGVVQDTKIKLKGMGLKGQVPGDLYLSVKIRV